MMIIFLLGILFSAPLVAEKPVTVKHAARQMVGIRIAYLGAAAERVAPVIGSDLTISGQFTVDIKEYAHPPHKKREITELVNHNILFLLILESHSDSIQYRLYDATTGTMVPHCSGRCMASNAQSAQCAHHIADKLWLQLTGMPSPFNTHIAYAKEVPYKKGITFKHLCSADCDGDNEIVMVKSPTIAPIAIAPRWGGTPEAPLIFYSEYTNTNVRLMVVDQNKKRKVVTRYDGVAMHFTPNHDGSLHAFSASRGDGISHIYLLHNGELAQCTHDDAINACPVFNHDSSILYYCSDAQTDIPHLMAYNFTTHKHTMLPIKGFCQSPAYNNARKLLAYSKMINGYLQIFIYNPATQQERQLTYDAGNHASPTWSPCGNFFAYEHDTGVGSRIRVHCYATGYERYITSHGVNCS
jgi:TolB protein